MKTDIHPQYNKDVKVTCACGATFSVGSTVDKISVEICSSCHPFYTGVDKIVDTAGRVEKFKARRAIGQASQEAAVTAAKKNKKPKALKADGGK
ncbi:50S ribosomal protein L31 [Patescibacteria group bacterium]|nr:50S ribosomal protein L31 [Patescibacteria group bacterium]MCH8889389.1 50S ribosomal protein L31 [Patescibacteria group bacterium]